jgi:gliding motility-associated-like protein
MKTILSIIFLGLLTNNCLFSQENLILNPNFEDSLPCFYGRDTIHHFTHWSNCYEPMYQINCQSRNIINGTTVYASRDTAFRAHSGKGYGWLITYTGEVNYLNAQTFWGDKRLYMMTPFKTPLVADKRYYFEMYVRPIPQLYSPAFTGKSASNGLGLTVSEENLVYNGWDGKVGQQLTIGPVKGGTNVVATNTVITNEKKWTKIAGCFTVPFAAKYATIGNFREGAQTALIEISPPPAFNPFVLADYAVDDVLVALMPTRPPLRDTALCEGDSLRLDVAQKYAESYEWNDGKKTPQYNITKSGSYTVETKFSTIPTTCDAKEYINVSFSPRTAVTRAFDSTFCLDQKNVKLTTGTGSKGEEITWQDGSKSPTLVVNKAGSFVADIKNKCGMFRDSFNVQFQKCGVSIFVPTTFSPNGDGVNDTFFSYFNAKFVVKTYELTVFNRWGDLIFKANDVNTPWDGTLNGATLPTDIFVWQLKINGSAYDKPFNEVLSGEVNLVK